jgi:glycosyltransferase involved in cell wall biosynthesis
MQLSVVIITFNEEANIGRTLKSVQPLVADGRGETIVVDSGSTDRTVEIAKSFGARVFIEEWKGFAAQKNSAIEKATGEWILSLDADEELSTDLAQHLSRSVRSDEDSFEWTVQDRLPLHMEDLRGNPGPLLLAFSIARKNLFLGRWLRHGGFYPDRKIRLFAKGSARFDKERRVHEDVKTDRHVTPITIGSLLHHSYPTLSDYIEHMNRYSSLGAEMVVAKSKVRFSFINIVLRPLFTFIYNYFFRLGFLDGPEGLLLHLYHAVYVSWKYAKAWELSRKPRSTSAA